MKRLVALSLLMMLLVNTASAESWGDLFGGLTSLFRSKDEVTYGIGEEVETGDLTVTLTDVLTSKGNSYYKPDSGKEYVILQFEIANNGKKDITLSTMMNFTFWCDDTICIIDLEALATAMLAGKYQLDCAVEAGEKVNGVIGYEIPSDWNEMKIEFKKEIYFGDTIVFLVDKEQLEEVAR